MGSFQRERLSGASDKTGEEGKRRAPSRAQNGRIKREKNRDLSRQGVNGVPLTRNRAKGRDTEQERKPPPYWLQKVKTAASTRY